MTNSQVPKAFASAKTTRSQVQWGTAVLLFLVTSLSFTGPGLLLGNAMGGVDIWAFSSPFRETTPDATPINNKLQTDQLEQIPLVAEFWTSARRGDLQLWEPDHAGGLPLLTAAHTRVLAPPNLAYAIVPPWMGAGAAIATALFLAQLGTFGLARSLRIRFIGALFAGVAYGFSGPVTALLLRVHETSMLPWLLWGVHLCFTGSRPRRAILMTAAATVGTVLSGFPAATLHVMYFTVAFALWMTWGRWRASGRTDAIRGVGRTTWAGVAGVMLAAPILLPTAEWLPQTGSLDRSFPITHALGLDRLATAVSGRFFGAPQDGDFWLADQTLANPVEASMTMGIVVLLVLAWLVSRPPRRGVLDPALPSFFVPAGLTMLVAVVLGGPILGLFHQFPFMDSNAFGRSRFIVALVIALMAGAGLDAALHERNAQRSRPPDIETSMRWGAALPLLMVIMGLYIAITEAVVLGHINDVATDTLVPVACGVLVAVAVVTTRRTGRTTAQHRTTVGAVAILALAVELQFGAWGFVSTAPTELFYPKPDLPSEVVNDVGVGGMYRFAATSLNTMPPHSAGLMDLSDLRVSYPAYAPWRKLLEVADPGVFEHRRLRTVFTDDVDWDSPVFDRLATRYVLHPLRDPLLQTAPAARTSVATNHGGSVRWSTPALESPVRGVVVPVTTNECRHGWVELHADGQLLSRRLAREVRRTSVFPVADVNASNLTMELSSATCDVAVKSPVVRYQLADGTLEVVSTAGAVIYARPAARPRVDLLTQITHVASSDEALEEVGQHSATTAIVTDKLDVDATTSGSADLRLDDPDRVAVETRTDGRALLVLRDVAAPGWNASIDGKPTPIVDVDHALRGVVVPPGRHTVSFQYWPGSLTVGLWLAALGALMLVSSWFRLPRRDR